MTELVRWEPFFKDFSSLARRFDPMVGWGWNGGEDVVSRWSPAVDIFDAGDDIVLQAELPGMKREDLDIRVENNVLYLAGERRTDRERGPSGGFHRSERSFGRFTRWFTLPAMVDVTAIDASYQDGILTIRLPKIAEARPRRIDVRHA